MVLAEKGNENVRNGRRSRGPSPNGHVATESTSEDESTVPVDKIRVGRDYQAICPDLQPVASRRPDQLADRALLVWSPTVDISEQKLDEYITLAKEKYGYNGEQALGMLFWHKHDLERAVLDLANFTPFPDEWSVEDKVLFEQAFQFHGKSFHRIRQMLPDKTIASLVKYYYSWKKTRSRTSLMDKQARKLTAPREEGAASEAGSEGGSNEESDADEKKWTIHRGIRRKSGSPPRADADTTANQAGEGGACGNCGVACSFTHVSPKGALCHSCFQHWRRTGALRPTSGPSNKRGGVAASLAGRHKRRPPRGMHINHDDLAAMAAGVQGMQMLRAMDREIVSLKRQVQQNKQSISALKRKTSEGIDDIRPTGDSNASRINARWTNEELLLAVQGVRKYGKDFKTIAETLGTKTESHLRSFFVNYRRRYNLDSVLKDFEKDNGPVTVSPDESMESPEKMDIDIDGTDMTTPTGMDVNVTSMSVSPSSTPTPIQTPTPTLTPTMTTTIATVTTTTTTAAAAAAAASNSLKTNSPTTVSTAQVNTK